MCFAREENAIIRKSQNQKHRPSTRRNMQALPPRRVTCCNGRKQIESIKPWRKAGKKVQGFQKGARQPKSRKPLRNRQSQNCLKDRRVPNMENRRGPLNRRIKKIFLFAAIEFWRQLYIYIYMFSTTPNKQIEVLLKLTARTCTRCAQKTSYKWGRVITSLILSLILF